MAAIALDNANISVSSKTRLIIVSYNLHGLNQGIVGLHELISKISPHVIFIQEHWLTSSNLYKLDNISADYYSFGSSAMNNITAAGPLYGRPFGGTSILIRKNLARVTKTIIASDRFTVIRLVNWLFINTYMPCSGTGQRKLLYNDTLQELQSIINENPNCQCLLGGDLNIDLNEDTTISNDSNVFIQNNKMTRCDLLYPVADPYTYVNDALNAKSITDYFLTTGRDLTIAFNIVDLDINLSDHKPIMAICLCDLSMDGQPSICQHDDIDYFRWDHASLTEYYNCTRELLYPVLNEIEFIENDSEDRRDRGQVLTDDIKCKIDKIYIDMVYALYTASIQSIPRRKKNFYKFWWSQELTILKENAISSSKIWKDAGRPRYGSTFDKYNQDKLLYKRKLKEQQSSELASYTNELHEALLNKQGVQFWKCWNSKFENKSKLATSIDGASDPKDIVNKFAAHFESVCSPFSSSRYSELQLMFFDRWSTYFGFSLSEDNFFTVELVSEIVDKMCCGKAPGLDGLSCEHLKYSHPVVYLILCKMFNLLLLFGYIPKDFGLSYTVAVPKCDIHSSTLTLGDFRGISISPVVSKVFELVILRRFANYFSTSDYQFGFKKHLSCNHAIYCVKNVIEHYTRNGTTVNMCSIDLSKAFDKMNQYAVLLKLMDRKVPKELIHILLLWFHSSYTCVKWGKVYSALFPLKSGVRQGGVLSPLLFSIFIDGLIDKICASNVGCYVSNKCVAIFVYADDIILLSPTVTGLQILFNVCEIELSILDMQINSKKTQCIRFGRNFDKNCHNLHTSQDVALQWVTSCRYLGVYFVSGINVRCSFEESKRKFFRAFNAIFGKVGRQSSETVILTLLHSKCIPVLLNSVEACPLLSRDVHSIEFTVTRTCMKIFRTGSALNITECLRYCGVLPISYQLDIRTARFLNKFNASENSVCQCFQNSSNIQLSMLYRKYGTSIRTLKQLNNTVSRIFFCFN